MYKLLLLPAALMLASCGTFTKSEEAVVLKVDTASMMKGRIIEGHIKIDNGSQEEENKTYTLQPVKG